jgi:hypothetical protein
VESVDVKVPAVRVPHDWCRTLVRLRRRYVGGYRPSSLPVSPTARSNRVPDELLWGEPAIETWDSTETDGWVPQVGVPSKLAC